MPIFTIPVQQQEQVSKYSWPNLMEGLAGVSIMDQLQRENLTPTGTPTLYTVALTGAGSAVMNAAGAGMLLTTGAVLGDDVDVRYEVVFNRTAQWNGLDARGTLELNVIFSLASATETEGFIGFIGSSTNAITALPTTAIHMGVFWDISAQANFILTSGNGVAQATTDSGVAVSTSQFRLNIRWTGTNTAVITLFSGTSPSFDTASTAHTVSSIGSNNQKFHTFIQTEAVATAKIMTVFEWVATIT